MADSLGEGSTGLDVSAATPAAHSLNVLIDTNVLLDLLLKRDPWFTESQPMWEARD